MWFAQSLARGEQAKPGGLLQQKALGATRGPSIGSNIIQTYAFTRMLFRNAVPHYVSIQTAARTFISSWVLIRTSVQ